jgi:hypothetical protein
MAQGNTQLTEAATQPTVLDLVQRLTSQFSTLFRQEIKLVTAEISASVTGMFLDLAAVASGAAVLYAGFLLLLLAGVSALAQVMPVWLASLSVGLAVCAVGGGLIAFGKKKLAASDLAPTHSPESLRRDKEVLTRKAP